jgi:hypothetical protein
LVKVRRRKSLGSLGLLATAAGQPLQETVKSLHAKIGELTLENDFLEVALGIMDDATLEP